MKKTAFIIGILFLMPSLSWAEGPIYTGFFSNKAVSGYDTVAYFTEGKPVKGKSKFKMTYKDAEWYFSSRENMELFRANPEKYAPQYGGHCAWRLAQDGETISTEPDLWLIVDGKLYLSYDEERQELFSKDIPGFIAKADLQWLMHDADK